MGLSERQSPQMLALQKKSGLQTPSTGRTEEAGSSRQPGGFVAEFVVGQAQVAHV